MISAVCPHQFDSVTKELALLASEWNIWDIPPPLQIKQMATSKFDCFPHPDCQRQGVWNTHSIVYKLKQWPAKESPIPWTLPFSSYQLRPVFSLSYSSPNTVDLPTLLLMAPSLDYALWVILVSIISSLYHSCGIV